MSLETGLVAFLADAMPDVPLYPLRLPQAPTLPALTYRVISTVGSPTHGGPSGLLTRRLQLDSHAADHAGSVDLAKALRALLDGYVGPWGDQDIRPCLFENELDVDEPDTKTYRRITDYMVTFRAAAGS